jgi:hypothetical protein
MLALFLIPFDSSFTVMFSSHHTVLQNRCNMYKESGRHIAQGRWSGCNIYVTGKTANTNQFSTTCHGQMGSSLASYLGAPKKFRPVNRLNGKKSKCFFLTQLLEYINLKFSVLNSDVFSDFLYRARVSRRVQLKLKKRVFSYQNMVSVIIQNATWVHFLLYFARGTPLLRAQQ